MNSRLINHLDTITQTDLQVLEAKLPNHPTQRARLYFLAAYSLPLAAFVLASYGLTDLFIDLLKTYPQPQTITSLPLPLIVGTVLMVVSWLVVNQAKRHVTAMFDNALADALDREAEVPH